MVNLPCHPVKGPIRHLGVTTAARAPDLPCPDLPCLPCLPAGPTLLLFAAQQYELLWWPATAIHTRAPGAMLIKQCIRAPAQSCPGFLLQWFAGTGLMPGDLLSVFCTGQLVVHPCLAEVCARCIEGQVGT